MSKHYDINLSREPATAEQVAELLVATQKEGVVKAMLNVNTTALLFAAHELANGGDEKAVLANLDSAFNEKADRPKLELTSEFIAEVRKKIGNRLDTFT